MPIAQGYTEVSRVTEQSSRKQSAFLCDFCADSVVTLWKSSLFLEDEINCQDQETESNQMINPECFILEYENRKHSKDY